MAVFDIAGTTVADNNGVADAFIKAFKEKGLSVSPSMVNPLMGYHKPLAIKTVLEQLGERSSDELVAEIHADFVREMLAYYESSPDVKPAPAAEETIGALKSEGIVIALNTGFSREIADIILRRLQWKERQLIDDYIASDEVPHGRPDPAMIRELMRRNDIADAGEVVKIGDTEVDIREGQNAGCRYSIAVTTGAFRRADLEPYHPDFIFDSLAELPAIIHAHV